MKFGFQLPTCIEGLYLNPHTVGPDELRKIAARAEELGFDSVWANDHAAPWKARKVENNDQPLNWYEPLVTLAHCAAVTKRIRLAVGVIVMPFREPVTLAVQAATLDAFSGGRFILGLGVGGARAELEMVFPRRAKWNRSAVLDEALESLKLLFSGDPVSFDGKYYSFTNVTLAHQTVQKPLPIFISAVSPSGIDRAARYASGLMTTSSSLDVLKQRIEALHKASESYGRAPSETDVAVSAIVCLDETHEKAIKRLAGSWMGRRLTPAGMTAEEFAAYNLIGTAEEVAQKVDELGRLGVTYIAPQHIAAETVPLHMEQMEMMGEGVLPLCRDA